MSGLSRSACQGPHIHQLSPSLRILKSNFVLAINRLGHHIPNGVLRGTPNADTNWPETRIHAIIPLARLNHTVLTSIFMLQKYFFCFKLSSGCSLFGLPFTNEELKKVGSWCHAHFCHTCRPHSCHKLLDTKWQCTWLCFHNFKCWFQKTLDPKSTEKLLWVLCLILFQSIGPVLFHSLETLQ